EAGYTTATGSALTYTNDLALGAGSIYESSNSIRSAKQSAISRFSGDVCREKLPIGGGLGLDDAVRWFLNVELRVTMSFSTGRQSLSSSPQTILPSITSVERRVAICHPCVAVCPTPDAGNQLLGGEDDQCRCRRGDIRLGLSGTHVSSSGLRRC